MERKEASRKNFSLCVERACEGVTSERPAASGKIANDKAENKNKTWREKAVGGYGGYNG